MTDLPMSFEWQMPVWIESADVDIEINRESFMIEVNDFEADTTITFNRELIRECLDLDDLYTLRRLCQAEIDQRALNGETTNAVET